MMWIPETCLVIRYIVIENLEGKLGTNRLFSGKLKLAFKIYFVATLNFLTERE